MNSRPITDTLFLARSKTKDPHTGKGYYGAYPSGFLEKARRILGCSKTDSIWHVCGGHAKQYNGVKGGITLSGFGENDKTFDIDPLCLPDFQGDVRKLEKLFNLRRVNDVCLKLEPDWAKHFELSDRVVREYDLVGMPDGIIIDRPYTPEDADRYNSGRDALPNINQLLRDCLKIVKPSGRVGVLDYFFPRASLGNCIGVYPVIAGTNCRVRVFTVWERTS